MDNKKEQRKLLAEIMRLDELSGLYEEPKYKLTNEILEKIFKEDWMDENDWNDMMSTIKQKGFITQLENALEVGVKNGYSVEQQIEIAKLIFK